MFVDQCKSWLKNDVLPLWTSKGVDWAQGGFYEAFTLEGEPQDVARRCMVQARQIYSLRICSELNLCDPELAKKAIELGSKTFLKNYSLSSGGFRHSANADGFAVDETPDLYAQAFALFGLANAYLVTANPELKERAEVLVNYLYRERLLAQGGFSELAKGQVLFEANPHMHLFESALAWMKIDSSPLWKKLADDLLELCLKKFIDPKTGCLAEHFNSDWSPILDNGNFIFEPGHHFEWAWLMGLYQELTHKDLSAVRVQLTQLAEDFGVWPERKTVIDEVWSNHSPKSKTSRFWPQCERIKVLLQLAQEFPDKKNHYLNKADEAMETLFKFFETPQKGLWFDTWLESGEFRIQPAKASSLYHITGAITEYIKLRN